jgi:hypothetical protein
MIKVVIRQEYIDYFLYNFLFNFSFNICYYIIQILKLKLQVINMATVLILVSKIAPWRFISLGIAGNHEQSPLFPIGSKVTIKEGIFPIKNYQDKSEYYSIGNDNIGYKPVSIKTTHNYCGVTGGADENEQCMITVSNYEKKVTGPSVMNNAYAGGSRRKSKKSRKSRKSRNTKRNNKNKSKKRNSKY